MDSALPPLSYIEAKETYATLHLFTQIIGKIKLGKQPWINHSWHVTLFVMPTGLTTSQLTDGKQHFQIDFDFIIHHLKIYTDSGEVRQFSLMDISVADFYNKVFAALNDLEIEAKINPIPCEIADCVPFTSDTAHCTYNPGYAIAFHKSLLFSSDVLTRFRSEFIGKASPVHFFWGSFDLAVSRFSGRPAPKHPGGVPHMPDWVAQEAYSHEVSSCGFWPGNDAVPYAAYYSYIYPEPEGFSQAKAEPAEAFYHPDLREFILPYEAVRTSKNPAETLLNFLNSTYSAAANLAQWDRKSLEKGISHRFTD